MNLFGSDQAALAERLACCGCQVGCHYWVDCDGKSQPNAVPLASLVVRVFYGIFVGVRFSSAVLFWRGSYRLNE